MDEVEKIEQLLRQCLRQDEEAYQLHRTKAFRWFERVFRKADISKDRVKFAIQKVTVGDFESYDADLVVMPDPTTPSSTGLSGKAVSTIATTYAQLAAYRMAKKVLAQYWESKFRDSSYRLLPQAVLPGEDPDVTHLETFSAPVQEGSRGGALVHATGLSLLSADHLLEDVVEENRQLDSISRGHARLIPRLERENRNMAFAQTYLVSILRQVRKSELQTYKMMDARDKAEEKLRWSEAERRKMAKQMEDLLRIIADRKILETTISDKVTELETHQRENQDNLTQLLRTVAYYHDKADRLEQTWRLTDAVRVSELEEL
ncbi:hypothetical protein PVAP13_1NG542301 [Panicum virgatum]|uniref:Uncharacterized protein n=1 Tax=Panicum virgatum TaxID=38727 RepID=A0A8T0X756_PANVG|nr:hypothetical protein PVAP13_1NG542301 [Panicum virgatum]